MDANKILSSDILDIVFDGRNKEYGAYELRRGYRRRLMIAIASMTAIIVLALAAYFLSDQFASTDDSKAIVVQDVQLEDVKQEEQEEPPPPPPPAPPPP